ncbi:MAG: Ig-like domain-containing protein [Planctomycetaceae bacterium]
MNLRDLLVRSGRRASLSLEHFTNTLRLRRSGVRQLEIVALEDRLMFSAAPVPAPAPAPDGQAVATASLEPAADSLAPLPSSTDVQDVSHTTPANVLEQPGEDGVLAPTSHELAFIDTGAENYQQLLDDLWSHQDPDRHLDVVLLSASEDGLTQITETLAQYQTEKLDAVHLVTHGADRGIKLGNTWLDSSSLNANRERVTSWREALNPGADLLIYGCDLAGNDLGQTLLNQLVELTGADIAASIDATGSALLGGDWELEYQVGEINTNVAFSKLLQSEWDSLLNAFVVPLSLTGTEARDNSYTLNEDSTVSGNVILDDTGVGSDSDAEGDTLTITAINGDIGLVGNAITLASGASLTVDANGAFTYDPSSVFNHLPNGQSGVDSFTYTIADPFGNSSTATVNLTINGVNDAPVAVDDSYALPENGSISVGTPGVLTNDYDLDGPSLSAAAVTLPSHAALFNFTTDGYFAYTPVAGYFGTDSFTYLATDGSLNSNVVTVTFHVTPTNTPTSITTNVLSITEGETVVLTNSHINTTDSDSSASQLVYTVSGLSGGQFELVANPGTPITSFTQQQIDQGQVQFTHDGGELSPYYELTVTDGVSTAGPSVVTIEQFSPVNDGPVITAPAVVNVSEFESWYFSGSSQIQISDPDASTVEVTITVNNGRFSLSQLPGLTFSTGDGTSDTVMTFTGSVSDVNAALMYSSFASGTSTGSSASISIEVNDLAGTGTGGPLTAVATTGITIALPSPVTSDAFLQGKYLEIGLGQDGVLGADGAAPSGFNNAGGALAVQVDRDRDGWNTYDGDFILPGTPEEAWGVRVNGTTYSNSNISPPEVTGGLANAQTGTGGQSVEWVGSRDNLGVRQIYSVGANDLYMDVVVELTNTGSTDFTDVYYYRNIDADNNMFHGVADSFTTTNTIHAQGHTDGNSLVSSTQSDGSYLALMGFGSNSRVTYGGFTNRDPQSIFDGTGGLQQTGSQFADEAISLAFHFSTIASGETVTAHFRYYFASTESAQPVVDLDANDSSGQAGGNYQTSFAEDGGPVSVVDSDASVFIADLSPVTGMTISIANLRDGIEESLTVDTTGTGIVATYDSGTGVLNLSGSASSTDYSSVLRTLTYNNTSQNPDTTTRTIEVVATAAGGSSAVVTSSVAITSTNDVPVVTSNSLTISEGGTVVFDHSHLNATDLDNTPAQLMYSVNTVSHGQFEYVAQPGVAITTFTQAEIDAGLVQFTHDGGESPPSYSLIISDGVQSSGMSDGVVKFTAINDLPSISQIADQIVPEDTVLGPLSFTISDAETPADLLTITAISSNPALIPNANLVLAGSGTDRTITLTPSANQFGGPVTITLTLDDGTSTVQMTFQVVIQPVNDTPVLSPATFTIPENSPNGTVVGAVIASDADPSDTLTYTISLGDPQHAFQIDPATGVITVTDTAQLDFEATPTWTLIVTVSDGTQASTPQTITINLTNLNEPPSLLPATFHVKEQSPVGTVVGTVQAVDQDAGDSLSYSIISGNTGGRFSIDPVTGLIRVADSTGFLHSTQPSYTLSVQAVDSQGLARVADFVIVVDSVNTPPVALNDQYSTPQNIPLTVAAANGLVANDSDVDATPVAAILVQGPQHGQVTLQPDGSFIYVPDAYYYGPDSFSYQVTDGFDVSGVATVALDVTLLAPSGGSMGPINPTGGALSIGTSISGNSPSGEDGDVGSGQDSVAVIIVSGPGFAPTGSGTTNRIPQVDHGGQSTQPTQPDGVTPIDAILATLESLNPTKQFQSATRQRSGTTPRGRSAQLVTTAVAAVLPDPIHDLTASILHNTEMWNQLNSFRDQLREQEQESGHLENLVVGSTTVVTGGMAVGYVVWLIRGGSLLATMVSVVPSWTSFDPLPVMERFAAEVRDDDKESLDSIVTGGNLAQL